MNLDKKWLYSDTKSRNTNKLFYHQSTNNNEYDNYESVEEEDQIKYETNTTKVEIEIKGHKIYAIVNSEAGKNVMKDKLQQKLQIKGIKPNKKRFTIVNEEKIASLGTVNTRIKFDNVLIPIEFKIIDSTEGDIILGTQ